MIFNIYFYILFLIACTASLNDILIYFLGIEYGVCILISMAIVALINIILIRKGKIKTTFDFHKYDIIFLIIMFFVTLITGIVYPEYVYDTISYHAYLQKNPFIDKINFDFFPGRIYCDFLFALGDRMYYIFRYFLGYRAGALLSFYLPIVLFYQAKKLLKYFGHTDAKCSILAYFIFIIYKFDDYIGTYYIDNIAVLFLFEGIILILTTKDIFKKRLHLYLLALFFGFAVAIKVTFLFFIFPAIIYLIIKSNKKDIKVKDLFICFILFIIPFSVYMLDNFKQTGSILFPYYNKIFKSEYFELENWKDERFGIDGIIRKMFWPIIVNILPKYGDLSLLHDYSWVVRLYIHYSIYNKKFYTKKERHKNGYSCIKFSISCYMDIFP